MKIYFDHTRLEAVLPIIRKHFFHTKTELDYETPFQFLMAVILSAQTTDKQVNKVTKAFFEKVRKPSDLQKWTPKMLESYLGAVNFYKNKCRFILESAKILEEVYNEEIPNSLKLLMELPWVGVKTAKVVLSVLYDAPYVGVDTHVHRVLNRIGIVKTEAPEKTDEVVEKKFSLDEKINSHHAFVLFGRYCCTAKNPKCAECLIAQNCKFFTKNKEK